MSGLEDDPHVSMLNSEEGPLEVINFTKMPEFPPHRAESWFRIWKIESISIFNLHKLTFSTYKN